MNNLETEGAQQEPLLATRPATLPDLRAIYPAPGDACSREDFLSHVARHEMSIKMDTDDGYRHITFQKPGTGQYAFHLVTWPGYLSISGDCGCFVFSRERDMFGFFRPDDWERSQGPLYVNPGYWGQKCVSRSLPDLAVFSPETFKAQVADWCADDQSLTAEEWRQIEDRVILQADEGHEAAVRAAIEFEFEASSDDEWPPPRRPRLGYFEDLLERDCTEWDFNYLWCLYAIVWGIAQYDARKKADARARSTWPNRVKTVIRRLFSSRGKDETQA